MARKPAVVPPPAETPGAMIASAATGTLEDLHKRRNHWNRRSSSDTSWQEECWRAYDTVGEFRFAADWVGSTMSKAVLFAQERGVGKPEAVRKDSGPVSEIVAELFDGVEGQAEMLRLIGIHFTVAAECFILSWTDKTAGDQWRVVASQSLKRDGGHYSIDQVKIDAPLSKVLCLRLWKPHPRHPYEAMSPSKAARGTLRELIKLSQKLDAQLDSRLAGAGILLMPSEIQLPKLPVDPDAETNVRQAEANSADDLMAVLQEVMSTAIGAPGSASAMVPIVITAPADAIEAVRHVTFWSELDEQTINLRTEAIGRLALQMDMPPEILTGAGDTNHWASFQADEASIKSYLQPLLKIVLSSLSEGYLRPAMVEKDPKVLRRWSIGADTSEMRLRPNRSKEALELYEHGELSGSALRRECGFSVDDKPTAEDLRAWLQRKVASGSTTPELVEAALRKLGVDLDVQVTDTRPPAEARPDPSLLDHPEQGPPDREESERRAERKAEQAALIAASEMMVLRTLERVGNRIKAKAGVRTNQNVAASAIYLHADVANMDLDFMLEDAWGHVPSVAERHGIDAAALTASLDSYCKLTMTTRIPHTFDRFNDFMEGTSYATAS